MPYAQLFKIIEKKITRLQSVWLFYFFLAFLIPGILTVMAHLLGKLQIPEISTSITSWDLKQFLSAAFAFVVFINLLVAFCMQICLYTKISSLKRLSKDVAEYKTLKSLNVCLLLTTLFQFFLPVLWFIPAFCFYVKFKKNVYIFN